MTIRKELKVVNGLLMFLTVSTQSHKKEYVLFVKGLNLKEALELEQHIIRVVELKKNNLTVVTTRYVIRLTEEDDLKNGREK